MLIGVVLVVLLIAAAVAVLGMLGVLNNMRTARRNEKQAQEALIKEKSRAQAAEDTLNYVLAALEQMESFSPHPEVQEQAMVLTARVRKFHDDRKELS